MILHEILLKEMESSVPIELNFLEEYLIQSPGISVSEGRALIALVEQMHQNVEAEMASKLQKAIKAVTEKFVSKIKMVRQEVAAAKAAGKSPSHIKKLVVKADNLKKEMEMAIHALKTKFGKMSAGLKSVAAKKVGAIKTAVNKVPKSGKIAAGVAGAGLAAYAGVKIYKNYMAKAARACTGKTGAEKQACIAKYKAAAEKAKAKLKK